MPETLYAWKPSHSLPQNEAACNSLDRN